MKRKLLITILCMLLLSTGLFAQSKPHKHDETGCRTSELMEALYKAHPKSREEAQKFNEFTKSFKSPTKATSYIIPVVFHVFGTTFNGKTVTDAIIQNALQKTNEDFQGLTADWNNIIAQFNGVKKAINITFKLAQIDPNGNPTTGITYHPTMSGFGNGSGYDSQIQQYAWNNYKYFNVYIQNDLYADGATNNSGVCWYPDSWMSDNNLARCVYNGAYLGSNTDENFRSVLTHEFGHYLNLIHTFEGGCPDAVSCSASGDQCCDTPPANTSNMNGALNCEGNVTNWQNFMDYTNNYAMYTINQVARMEAALQHAARFPLWQAANLTATGVNANLGPRIVTSTSVFEESYINNGSISTSSTLTAIDGAQFAVTGNLTVGTHFNTSNVPLGLTLKITVNSSTSATVTFTGNASAHANANDISNMSITFLNAAIVGGVSGLYSATLTNLSVNFIDPYKIIYQDITDITANSTATWTYLALQNGADFGVWYDAAKLRLETYTKSAVCEGTTKNITPLAYNTPISSTSNWVAGGAYPNEHDIYSSSYTSWAGKTAYIGFQISNMGQPCYGWFKAIVASNGASYTITEYAYNEEPYATIYAGVSTVGILPPTNLSASNITQTGCTLNWTASAGAVSYDVYRGGTTLIGSSNTTSINVTGLTAGTNYSFTVKAKNSAGNVSAASTALSVTTVAGILPPTNLAASNITQTGCTLTWTASTNATGYDVYRGGTTLVGNSTAASFNVTGLTASTNYSFTVKAKDAAGNVSAPSAPISVTTSGGGYCTSKGSSFTYEWIASVKVGSTTKTSGAAGYTDFTSTVFNMTQGSNSITLTPGFASTTYTEYWIVWIDLNNNQSFNDAGEQLFSGNGKSAITGTITIPTSASGTVRMRISMKYNAVPTSCETFSYGEVEDYTVSFGGIPPVILPPTNLNAPSVTSTSVTLTWTASANATGYDVYKGTVLAGSTSTTSYTVTGLTPSTTYSFTVKAKDAGGNVSSASNAITATTSGGSVIYCSTSHSSPTSYFYISNVTLGSINNSSVLGNSTSCYSDYTTTGTNLIKGSTYTLSEAFTPGWSGNSGAAWIDWNGDGDFDDSGEKVLNVSSATSPYTASFTVPSSAVVGSTRMRVRLTYNGTLTPCGVMYYGETEDYTVNITASTPLGPLSNTIDISVFPNPNDGNFKIVLPGLDQEAIVNAYSMNGQLVFHTSKRLGKWPIEMPVTISNKVAGVYTIQIITGNTVVSKQIIIK